MKTPTLAEALATALLTPHGGPEGTRLAIKLKRPDGTESDLGGNNKQSVIDTVNRVLKGRQVGLTFAERLAALNDDELDYMLGGLDANQLRFARELLARINGKPSACIPEPRTPKPATMHHINGNQWDNRPENLRVVDPAENRRPRKQPLDCKPNTTDR